MPIFPDVAEALSTLTSLGWRLAILTNCDEDLFAETSARLPVPFDVVVTAERVRSYKPDLGHFRTFAELTGATPANWIHVANSWVHDILPAARMGLRSVWVDRDHTGHPAKFAERRVTTMRRLPETVTDVSALPAWPVSLGRFSRGSLAVPGVSTGTIIDLWLLVRNCLSTGSGGSGKTWPTCLAG
jgi:FMN phosphatase YigB (HAD superfamily)